MLLSRGLPRGPAAVVRRLWPAGVGLLLGVLALGPALRPGFVLAYDMVFVPDPVFSATAFGFTGTLPRAVPSDVLVTALTFMLPGQVVQKLILLAVFTLAGSGVASLLRRDRAVVRLAASVFYTWNPFVAERLLLGQWALLLGYAGLPWAVRATLAAADGRRNRSWIVAFVPAMAGGFMAMIITALTVLPVAAVARAGRRDVSQGTGGDGAGDRAKEVGGEGDGGRAKGDGGRGGFGALPRTALACAVLSMPWLVPSLLHARDLPGDGAAVAAFAVRADSPLGPYASLLSLSGVWNAQAVPGGYDTLLPAVLHLLLALAAIIGFAGARDLPGRRGLAIASCAGFMIAALGITEPGRALLRSLIAAWPGVAVLRDAQQYVAPLALLQALGIAALARLLVSESDRGECGGGPGCAVRRRWPLDRIIAAGLLVPAPLLLLPGLAFGGWGRLAPVDYPVDFERVRALVAADPVAGDVLVLPWESYRSYDWNGRRSSLDPLPRYLPRRVVWNDAVRVGDAVVGAEDPRARELDRLVRSGADLAEPLRRAGFRFVVLDGDTSEWNTLQSRLSGTRAGYIGSHAALYVIDRPENPEEVAIFSALIPIAWLVAVSYLCFHLSASRSSLGGHEDGL